MQYRLLRNNKESGPYTKAQLEEMGLKPYDLLWLEGRGGAWQYASEIDDLKSIAPAVEEQPYDRFYKKSEKVTTSTNSKQNTSSANNNNSSNTTTLKPPKPRFRISGDKVVMIDNAALQQPKPLEDALSSFIKTTQPATVAAKPVVKQEIAQHVQSVGLDWEEAYSDWKGEDQEKEEKPAPAKAQTMEEVRQRYEEAKLKQLDTKQNKTAGTARQNIMAAVAIAVLAIGGYAGYKINQSGDDGSRTTQSAPAVEKAAVIQNESNSQQNTLDAADASTNSTTATQQAPDKNDDANAGEIKNALPVNNTQSTTLPTSPVETNNSNVPDNEKGQPVTSVKNTTANTVAKPDQKVAQQSQLANTNKTKQAATNNVATVKSTNEDNSTPYDIKKQTSVASTQPTPANVPPPVVKQEAPAKKISDFIIVSRLGSSNNSGSVQNILLSVKNVADFPIDLAVIDVQYYGASGRYQKGETMYVRNIGAGDNINIRVPDNSSSRSITYKVSLVSSEQKTLYLVGD